MKKKSLLLRFAVLVTAMMCALGASAEADVCDFSEDGIFYKIQSGGTTVHVWYEDGSSWDPCYTVDDYNIPETVTHGGTTYTVTGIGHTAFFGCTAVTHISLPKTLTMIGEQAFAGCTSLNSVYCHAMTPPTLKSNAFDATSYNNVLLYVPASVTSAYASADNWSRFQNLNSLRYHFESNGLYYNISGSNTVSVVRKDDYYNSEAYKGSINIPASVTNGGTTYNVTYISSQAFYRCWDLTEVNIGDNVTSIGSYAFQQCTSLTWVSIPATVTSIGVYAFTNCTSLTTIICWATTPPSISTAFNGLFDQATLYVPASAVSTYKATTTWKNFSNIKPIESSETEAYACYTSSNKTLTFYYDSYRSSRSGTTYDLNTDNLPEWVNDHNAIVLKVVFDRLFANARPTSTCGWFLDMQYLQTITDMNYLNTSEVTDMSSMFALCPKLTSLDLSSFNTSKVIDVTGMFNGCNGLTSLDLSSFNTSKVTYMTFMFADCTNLRTIYVGDGWSTAAVGLYSDDMFNGCTSLVGGMGTTYDENHVDKAYAHIDGGPSNPGYFTRDPNSPEAYACYTPSNTTLTFYYDNQRSSRTGTTYDLNTDAHDTGWDTDGTKSNVTKVVFDPSFAGARPTTTYDWFYRMENLQSFTGMSYLNTSEVINMAWMFGGCEMLTSLDLSSFNTAKVTYMSYMFNGCTNLQTIYVGNGWSTAAVTYSTSMFNYCTSLVGGQGTTYNDSNPKDKTYAHIDGGPSNPGYFTEWKEAYACYTPSNTTLTFYYDTQRSSRTGTTYDLNTGENYTGWDTDGTKSNVTKVVFDPSFTGARPTTTYDWFYGMTNLQSVTGLSYLNTSEVTNMAYMFMWCTSLTSLDVSRFNTSKVTSMRSMFKYCTGLTSLDLGSFNTSKVNSMYNMFYNSYNLRTIYAGSGWSTAAVTSSTDMFLNCSSLVGGQGTTYNASHVDKAYAHIDGGPSNPGYFSEKGGAFLRGDVNGDGQVKISDVTALINYLLSGDASAINLQAADCNQDGNVKIGDVTALINYLLSGTW